MRQLRIRRRLCLLGASIAALQLHNGGEALPLSSFTAVNWSLVTVEEISAAEAALLAPIGCTCVESRSSGQCPFFQCGCTCDVTAGACDPLCCCDKECSTDHIADVNSRGLCVDAVPVKPSIEYCSTELTLSGLSTGVNALVADSVLCVAVDNNEVVGNYIAAAKEEEMTAANAFLQNPKQYSFLELEASSGTEATAVGLTYRQGDTIPVFAKSSQAAIRSPVLTGFAPAAGSLRCTQRNLVQFAVNWDTERCVHEQIALDQVCGIKGGFLDPEMPTSNLLIAKVPSITSADQSSKDVVAIAVEVHELDATTGVTSKLSAPLPSYYPQPQLATTTDALTCQGALVAVDFRIFHDGNGTIERATAVVVISDVTTSIDSSTGDAALVDVSQAFTVTFTSTASISRSLEQGNLQTYMRSGNPGYQVHRPVRVGIIETSKATDSAGAQAVSEMVGGLTLPEVGACDATLAGTPVLFGEDTMLSCSLSLDAASFQSMCERVSPVLPSPLRVNFTHVATFGNSDPFLVDEWLAIDYDEPTRSTATFVAETAAGTVEMQCKNVLSSLHFEFLVAPVGPANDPQNKIIAARATHGKDTWTYWKNAQDVAKKETYLLHTTVTFITVASVDVDQWIPPMPPIWFSIPRDVFYPFMLSHGSHTAQSSTAWVAAAIVATLLAL